MTRILSLTAAFLLFAGAANAGTLTSATWTGNFQGTPFTLVTSGASLTASGTSTATGIGVVNITVAAPTLTILDTTGQAPTFISQTLGGSQTLTGNVANQGVAGAVNVYIGTNSNGTLLFPVALSAGVAGNFTTTALVPGLNIPVEVTATFFPWITGSQQFTGTTVDGAAGPNGGTTTVGGTNSLVGGVGSITLVSPTVTRVCVGAIFGSFPCTAGAAGNQQASTAVSVTSLKLNFTGTVPEPGTMLLLGAGIVGLAAVGRRQRS